MRRFVAWSLVVTLVVTACTATGSPTPSPQASPPADSSAPPAAPDKASSTSGGPADPFRLVTLGDAYTHGTDTSAPRRDSWPAQLVDSMSRDDVRVWLRNLAEQGQTSGRLLEDQLTQVASLEPDVVTIQVGVNDIIAREVDSYGTNIASAFDELLTILPPERIIAITTPDHTLTEWGDAYGSREAGRTAVTELNGSLTDEALSRDIVVIDISTVNDLAARDPSLVIESGPYPSAKQYAGWVEVIGPHVRSALATVEP